MKKILVERVREEAKYFCDKHPDRECFTQVKSMCWYGSKFDLFHIHANLCDDCLDELYKFMKEKFGVEPFDDELSLLGHCACWETNEPSVKINKQDSRPEVDMGGTIEPEITNNL